jgi:hypothetical protein
MSWSEGGRQIGERGSSGRGKESTCVNVPEEQVI